MVEVFGYLPDYERSPFSLGEAGNTTDWEPGSYGVTVDKSQVNVHKTFLPGGTPQYSTNAAAINAEHTNGTPERLPYPGETGERNTFRGDGYIDLDSSRPPPQRSVTGEVSRAEVRLGGL